MGCGASAAAAPNLKNYFNSVEKFAKEEADHAMKMMGGDPLAMMFDADGQAKLQKMQEESEARAQKFKTDSIKLLEKSFDHHDKSGDGVLNAAESQVFFANLVDLNTGSIIAMARWSTKAALDASVKAMQGMMGREMAAEMKKQMQAQAKEALKDLEEQVEKAVEAYKKDKENKDKAAFALLDVNKDGKLQKTEFLAAFDVVDGNKNRALLKTLGLDVGENMWDKMQGPQQQMEMPADCPTQ